MLNATVEDVSGHGPQGTKKVDGLNEFLYVQVPANTAKGTPLVITFDGDEEIMVKGVAPATATFQQLVGITPKLAGAAAEFMYVQVKGICQALVDSTTDVAKDDFLEVINAGVALIKDGAARTTVSVGVACEARTADSAGLITVQLIGEPCTIAAA